MLLFMQSFALPLAKLCVASCKALRCLLQSIALPLAKHCNNHCLEFVELTLNNDVLVKPNEQMPSLL